MPAPSTLSLEQITDALRLTVQRVNKMDSQLAELARVMTATIQAVTDTKRDDGSAGDREPRTPLPDDDSQGAEVTA